MSRPAEDPTPDLAALRRAHAAGARDGVLTPTFAELDGPDSVWNALAAAEDVGDPFCRRTEWQWSYHESFASKRALFFRRVDDSMVGFAERSHPQVGALLEPIEASWMFGCPLLGEHAIELARRLQLERMLETGERRMVGISGLEPGGPLERRLLRELPHRGVWKIAEETFCCASLDGGLDGFLSRRSAKLRKNLRQAQRRADGLGLRFDRHVPRTSREADAVYRRMLAVEETSWKGIAREGMNVGGSKTFYRRMLRRLARAASGRVVFARVDDRDVGFIFGGMAGKVYRGQQFSYAEDWSRHSIGNLLQVAKVGWLCEEGAVRYDMGPHMPYKVHWTELHTHWHTLLLG